MKRIKLILCGAVGLLLASACSDSTVPQAASEPWNIAVSRADGETVDGTYSRILVLGKEDNAEKVTGILKVDGATGTWEGTPPTWTTGEQLDVYAVSPVPEGNVLPSEIDLTTGQGTAWLIDYQPNTGKPTNLTMNHILAKLVVHIRIDSEANPEPMDAEISLVAKGKIDYPNKTVDVGYEFSVETVRVPLGDFHQVGQDDHSTEHNWEMTTAIVVIPQTIPAHQPCLWFTAGGKQYSFTPEYDLRLEVGKVNNLYLGVAADKTTIAIHDQNHRIDGFDYGDRQNGNAGE